jgi:hypothetical protein
MFRGTSKLVKSGRCFWASVLLLILAARQVYRAEELFERNAKAQNDMTESRSIDGHRNLSVAIHFQGRKDFRELMLHSWNPARSTYTGVCRALDAVSAISDTALDPTTTTPHRRAVVSVNVSCAQIYADGWGTGNVIELLYTLRLQCLAYNATLVVSCPDAKVTSSELVLPWLLGTFQPAESSFQSISATSAYWASPNGKQPVTAVQRACNPQRTMPLGRLYRDWQFRLRVMAICLAGLPLHRPTHPSHAFAAEYIWPGKATRPTAISFKEQTWWARRRQYTAMDWTFFPPTSDILSFELPHRHDIPPLASLFKEEPLDDVAIHFRCGDLMGTDHGQYEFLKFSGYARYISPEARTIGIVTQSFAPPPIQSQNSGNKSGLQQISSLPIRSKDFTDVVRDRCLIVVSALVEYIQQRHPHSLVSIRNGPRETIPSSYVRLIMANQTIAGISSTFGVFPTTTTFGTGYLSSPERNQSALRTRWMVEEFANQRVANIILVEGNPHAKVSTILRMWETQGAERVVEWFRS